MITKREFNKLFDKVTTNKRLDLSKIPLLTNKEREEMVIMLVRGRHAIVKELIPKKFDWEWLHSMGYLYEAKRVNGYTFVCTSENNPYK